MTRELHHQDVAGSPGPDGLLQDVELSQEGGKCHGIGGGIGNKIPLRLT